MAIPGAILLIDEIENGFHYSTMPDVWKIIARVAADNKCQVFATTHSQECLEATQAVKAEDEALYNKLFQLVRIDWIDGKATPCIVDSESLSFMIDMGWGMR